MIGAGEDLLLGGVDGVCLAVMDLIGCYQADAGMMVVLIVPGQKASIDCLGVLDAAEALGAACCRDLEGGRSNPNPV